VARTEASDSTIDELHATLRRCSGGIEEGGGGVGSEVGRAARRKKMCTRAWV
jgi:hypothetical protein